MQKSIARKLTLRVALLLLLALIILIVGSYHAVNRMVLDEDEQYATAVLSMYGDMIVYEAQQDGVPVDENYFDKVHLFNEYICTWYRVEYIYLYTPDTENGTARFVDFCYNDFEYNKEPRDWYQRDTEYEFSPAVLDVWNGKSIFGISDLTDYYGTFEICMRVTDDFGNNLIAGVAISETAMLQEALQKFNLIAAVLLGVFILLTLMLYFMIVKRVSQPAKQISRAMTDFIANGKRTDVRLPESRDEFGMIASAFNNMTSDIDKYLSDIRSLNEDKADQQSQLETASYIQKGFLPPEKYMTKDFALHAVMDPAKDVGGDLYDYLPLGDGRLLFVVADVSGKGMPAAMFMSVTLMLIRQFAKSGLSPARILESVNNTLSEQNPRMLFATAFVGIYNSNTKELVFSNAGHNPPYILHDSLRKPVTSQNTVLGLFSDESYAEETVTLRTGDVLFLYTDGVDESTDPDNHFYGTDRLEQTLLDAKAAHEDDLIRYVTDSLTAFSAGTEQHDDITLLTLTVKDTYELKLDADVREFSKIRETILKCDLPRQLQLDLCVAAEEIFVNICSHAFDGKPSPGDKIGFTLEHSDRIVMRFTDSGSPYDPRENVISADDYDMDLQIGGLGKLIAFSIADKVDYVYSEGQNILTVKKYIKEEIKQ